jgi:hypothetical protein
MARLLALKDIEIPTAVAELEALLGKDWIKQRIKEYKHFLNRYDPNKHNFWSPYFHEFYQWREKRKRLVDIPIPSNVAELANWALMTSIFRKDWEGEQKHHFLARLRKNDSVLHLLFELVVGLNYYLDGYDPTLIIDNQGGRKPDLILQYSQGHEIYVECARRIPKSERSVDLTVLVNDLIDTLKDKKESKVDWGGPRVVAIHIPEKIDLMDRTLRKTIGKKVYREFMDHEQYYENVNVVVFSGDRIPEQIGNVSSTDIPCLGFRNISKTRYQLPSDFRFAGE